MRMSFVLAAALVSLAGGVSAQAQLRVLLADRTAGKIWSLTDRNNDGAIDAGEIRAFYDATNAAGSPGILNPNTMGVTTDGYVVIGDQDALARHWLVLRDANFDGDALDAGESYLGATAANVSGASFAFPTGFAEAADGRVYLVNAGNTFGPDQIYIANDTNDDGDIDDDGEVINWVTINGFGTNGSYSPQEIVFGTEHGGDSGALYLRNSSANLQGLFRLVDNNSNSLIDQASEFTLFWGIGNASGITPSAGFAIDVDPTRPSSFYYHQLATGGVDQILRLTDSTADNDAQDEGESAIAFSTAEAGFTSVDLLALPDGRVLFSDNSGIRIISLRDNDGDDAFTSPGERSDFLPVGSPGVLAARAMAILYCPGDFNHDLSTNGDDLGDYINCFFSPQPCDLADFNQDGNADGDDLADFINVFFGPC